MQFRSWIRILLKIATHTIPPPTPEKNTHIFKLENGDDEKLEIGKCSTIMHTVRYELILFPIALYTL